MRMSEFFNSFSIKQISYIVWLLCIFAKPVTAAESLTDMPLEQLLEKEVVTASKIARQVSDSPSAVSIVTSKDIKAYGYRTLAEIINSMRGLNTISDHTYTYMSGRGFGRPGDYPGRVMLLIDGHQANDNLYNASYLGNDGLLDAELIERVEYVSGPGAVSYGNGAFYGIINVVTKKGGDFNGVQLGLDAASHRSFKQRLTYGNKLDNGAEVLISASSYQSDGRNLFFPEFNNPANNFGAARNLDEENNRRYFFKGRFEQWSLEAAYVNRLKEDPAASYGADFNARPSNMRDRNGFVNLRFEDNLTAHLKTAIKTYYGQYDYTGRAVYGGDFYHESNTGRWWGSEAKFAYTGFDNHQIVYGIEYRNDYKQDFLLPTDQIRHSSYIASTYLQDEYRWSRQLAFNFGVRGDYAGDVRHLSPRTAIIYSPDDQIDIKLSYATAFRKPNAYEKYYNEATAQIANPNLKKEVVDATELVIEYRPDFSSKLLSSLYRYNTKNLIEAEQLAAGIEQFANVRRHEATGWDIEYAKQWSNNTRMRASYAWQYAEHEDGTWLANSPKHLAKINLTRALLGERLQAGFESQYIGKRLTENGDMLGSYVVSNLTFYSSTLIKNSTVSFSIKNLFDREFSVPAPTFFIPNSFGQDGRTYWLQFTHDFKQ